MDFSKLQIIALCVLTTILTDKYLINHASNNVTPPIANIPTPTVIIPIATASANTNTNSQNEIILRELINIRKDMNTTLNDLKKQSTDSGTPVPTLSSSLLSGMVKISSAQWKRVEVFEKPQAGSKVINSIVYDSIYFYRQKQADWYQLDLDGGQTGWVQSQFLKEFP